MKIVNRKNYNDPEIRGTCSWCGKPCRGVVVCEDYGSTEFWGYKEHHRELGTVSHCCQSYIENPQYK